MTIIVHENRWPVEVTNPSEGGSPDRLKRAIGRVERELRAAGKLAREVRSRPPHRTEFRNAAREGCLLRLLRVERFFYGSPRRGEVVAADFFRDPREWEEARSGAERLEGLDRLASHLDDRIRIEDTEDASGSTQDWQLAEIVSWLSSVYRLFLRTLTTDRSENVESPTGH